MRYGIKQFKKDFPNDDKVLDFIFNALHSKECSCGGSYSKIKSRKQYQCSKCRYQIAPLSGTIFHKSATPLTLWFHSIFVFAHAKSGISAKELERQLGTTYKTAWRILNRIRKALKQSGKLKGLVEMDSAYFGGRAKAGKNSKNLGKVLAQKSVVMAGVSRNEMRAEVVKNAGVKTNKNFLERNVKKGSVLLTDNSKVYTNIKGYERHAIDHSKSYTYKGLHINTVEGFWSHAKRSIKGTHKTISKKHLQSYLNGFVFHYNNRHSDSERFSHLLGALLGV